jgi:preprotein translocase subunit SecE
MAFKSLIQDSRYDSFKLASAALLLLVGVLAFYYFDDYLVVVRAIGLLIAAGIAVAIALQTEQGNNLLGFIRESRAELRKVVWPTRAETIQTSLAVVVMVILMGIFLWLLDMFLLWIVRLLTG